MMISFEQAYKSIIDGKLVVVPTDTIFGFAVDSANENGINQLYNLKGRSKEKPLAILVSSIEMLESYVENLNQDQLKLMERFWPGALTLIFNKQKNVSDVITAGKNTVGIRMPNHREVLNLINKLGRPLVATSVNFSNEESLKDLDSIKRIFPDLEIMSGEKPVFGIESTVLDVSGAVPKLVREGFWKKTQIEEVLGKKIF